MTLLDTVVLIFVIQGTQHNPTLEADPPKMGSMFVIPTDWKDNWTAGTVYKANDLVKYGGNIYICNTGLPSPWPSIHLDLNKTY